MMQEPPRRLIVVLAMFVATVPFALDMYLPGLPGMAVEFGVDAGQAAHSVSAFLFGLALGQLLMGPLSDRYGRRAILALSLAIYTVANVACALATSIAQLVAFRVFEALGAGAAAVIVNALVRDMFEERASASVLSFVFMVMLMAPLFAPLQLRSIRLRNRIVMAPMTRNFSPAGVPGPDVAAYYRRRAEAETGLIITEGVGVDHPAALGEAGIGESDLPDMHGAAALAGWRHVVEQVHEAGGVVFPQLWHQGPMRMAGTGRNPDVASSRPSGLWGPAGGLTSSPSDYVDKMLASTAPMSEAEIADVIAAYARSAAHARDLGFDGIALHGGHGYLLDSFMWEETNRRTDMWGGDRTRRSRFAAEVVKAVRAAVGPDLPILYRFSQWKQQDFKARLAHTPQELEEILAPLADAGVDVFDASVRYFHRAEFAGDPV